MFNIEEELKKLPQKPGVYIMHDKNDNVINIIKLNLFISVVEDITEIIEVKPELNEEIIDKSLN